MLQQCVCVCVPGQHPPRQEHSGTTPVIATQRWLHQSWQLQGGYHLVTMPHNALCGCGCRPGCPRMTTLADRLCSPIYAQFYQHHNLLIVFLSFGRSCMAYSVYNGGMLLMHTIWGPSNAPHDICMTLKDLQLLEHCGFCRESGIPGEKIGCGFI